MLSHLIVKETYNPVSYVGINEIVMCKDRFFLGGYLGEICSAVELVLITLSILAGVGKSCLLLRFSDGSFTTSFITTIGWVSFVLQSPCLLFVSVHAVISLL